MAEEVKVPQLAEQDITKLNPNELNPLSMVVMSRQATINIGIVIGLCRISSLVRTLCVQFSFFVRKVYF